MRSTIRYALSVFMVGSIGLAATACGGDGASDAEEDLPIVVEEGGPIALGEAEPTEEEIDIVDEEPEPRVVERTVVVRERPRPRTEAPREEPVRAEPEPAPVTAIPAGTRVPVTILARIDSENHDVGSTWSGRVARDVVVRDRVVIPAGAAVSGVVTAIDEGDKTGQGSITLVARSLETAAGSRSIAAAPTSAGESYEDKGFPTKETAIGAGAGAAIGAIVGGKKGAAIGAAAGGAGGAAMGSQRNDQEVAIGAGTTVTIRLDESVNL